MQQFKIEDFEKEHGKGSFVWHRHLAEPEADALRETIQRALRLPDQVKPLELTQHILEKSEDISGVDAESPDFKLTALLAQLGLEPSPTVFLDWHRFDNVDEVRTEDLSKHFDDIWYPAADDLFIVDPQLRWIVLILHYGAVALLKLC